MLRSILDYEDKHYGRRKTDLENRLSRVYDKIEEVENVMEEADRREFLTHLIEMVEISLDNNSQIETVALLSKK